MRRKVFIFVLLGFLFSSCEKDQLVIPERIIKQNSKASAESVTKQTRKRTRKNRRFWKFKIRKSDTTQYANKRLF